MGSEMCIRDSVDTNTCASGQAYYDDVYINGQLVTSTFVACFVPVNQVETPIGSGQPTIIAPNGTVLSNNPATFQVGNATILAGFGGTSASAQADDTLAEAAARQRISDIFATIGVFGAGGYVPPTNVTVNVAGSVITEQDLTSSILDGLYEMQKRGQNVVYNAVAL